MSTKKGYIVKHWDTWTIKDKESGLVGHPLQYTIHPDSLPTILSNGSLKPEYQGEVEYEEERAYEVIIKNGTATKGENYTTYAIPKPVESNGDVWEEVADIMRQLSCSNLAIETCKGIFTLTKKHP